MSALLRAPWLELVVEKELRSALDQLLTYVPGTHVEKGNLTCSEGRIRIKLGKKRAVQIIDVSVNDNDGDDNISVKVSDGSGLVTALFEQEVIEAFQKHHRRKFQSIRGAICTITDYQIVFGAYDTRKDRLMLCISSFKLIGSEGSRTFGNPSSITDERKVQELMSRLGRLLSLADDEGEHIASEEEQVTNTPLISQPVLNTQIMHTQVDQVRSKNSRTNTGKQIHKCDMRGNSWSEGRREDRLNINRTVSPLAPIPDHILQQTTTRLESRFNMQHSKLHTSSQSAKSTTRGFDEARAHSNSRPGSESDDDSISDVPNPARNDSRMIQREEEIGQSSTVNIDAADQTRSQAHLVDVFQQENPFQEMKRVPRKYVRTPRDQQTLLEGDSWFKADVSAEKAVATLPELVRDTLLSYINTKQRTEADDNRSTLSSTLLHGDSADEHMSQQSSEDVRRGDDEESMVGSDYQDAEHVALEALPDEPVNTSSPYHFEASPTTDTPKDRLHTREASLEDDFDDPAMLDDTPRGKHKSYVSEVSSPIQPLSPARGHKKGVANLEDHRDPQSGAQVREASLELAVPYVTECLLIESEEDDEGEETPVINHGLPSTAVNNSVTLVQVERTPYVSNRASLPSTSGRSHEQYSDDESDPFSDPVIPATHADLENIPQRAKFTQIGDDAWNEEGQDTTSPGRLDNELVFIVPAVRGVASSGLDSNDLDTTSNAVRNPGDDAHVVEQHTEQGDPAAASVARHKKDRKASRSRKHRKSFRHFHKVLAAQVAEESGTLQDTTRLTKETRRQFRDNPKAHDGLSISADTSDNEYLQASSFSDFDTGSSARSLNSPALVHSTFGEHHINDDLIQDEIIGRLEDVGPGVQSETNTSQQAGDTPSVNFGLDPPMYANEAVFLHEYANTTEYPALIAGTPLDYNLIIEPTQPPESFLDFEASVLQVAEDSTSISYEQTQQFFQGDSSMNVDVSSFLDEDPLKEDILGLEKQGVPIQGQQNLLDSPHGAIQATEVIHISEQRQLTNGSVHESAVPHTTSTSLNVEGSLFDQFNAAYPEYTGTQYDFTLALVYIEYLVENGIFGHSHMCDDFIRFYPEDYLALQGDKINVSGWELFKRKVKRPLFELDIIASENLGDALSSLNKEEVSRLRDKFVSTEPDTILRARSTSIQCHDSIRKEAGGSASIDRAHIVATDMNDKEQSVVETEMGSEQVPKPSARHPFFETASQLPKRREADVISPPPVKRTKTSAWPEEPETPQISRMIVNNGNGSHPSPDLGRRDFVPQSDRGPQLHTGSPFAEKTKQKQSDRRRTLPNQGAPRKKAKISLHSDPQVFMAFLQKSQLARSRSTSRSSTPSGSVPSGKRYSLIPKSE